MNENFDAFDEYVMTFNMNDTPIVYKYNHSYRVVHQVEEICRSIDLNEEERDIASLIGLLHDTGRFNQLKLYNTYDDSISLDHALEANKVLFEEGLIKKFKYNKKYESIIEKAIFYHNKASIGKVTPKQRVHCQIIRDADKLDILYAFSTNKLIKLDDDDSKLSEKVIDSFMNHEILQKKDCKTKNDRILLTLGLIYDLNYDYSFNRVKEEGYVDKIYKELKNKKIFKKYVNEINSFLKERGKC